jgi:hypothetical protein
MFDLASEIIIEYGLTGLLVVISVGILLFSLKHVSKIIIKIEDVHKFYNEIIGSQHKEHKAEINKLNNKHELKVERITDQFMGSLEVIHSNHLLEHQEVRQGQDRIEKIVKNTNDLFNLQKGNKNPH